MTVPDRPATPQSGRSAGQGAAVIPESMTGAWVRAGLSLDGAAPVEDELVWWLQAPSKHCDLRIPLHRAGGVTCFAGTTTWAEPALTWTHEVELEPSSSVDAGVISWDGEDLIETGTFGDGDRRVEYVERWQRLAGGRGDLLALSTSGGRLVRTGRYALTIIDRRLAGGPFAAVAWLLHDDRWTAHHSWPHGAVAPAPPPGPTGGETTALLEDGTEWTVDEHRNADGRGAPTRA